MRASQQLKISDRLDDGIAVVGGSREREGAVGCVIERMRGVERE
jgi:hypothetical protein